MIGYKNGNMLDKLKRRQLFIRKFLSFFLPIFIVTTGFGTAAAAIMIEVNSGYIRQSNDNLLRQAKESIEMLLRNVDAIALAICQDINTLDTMAAILDNEVIVKREDRDETERFYTFVSSISNSNPYVYSTYVYVENKSGKLVTTTESVPARISQYFDRSWYESYLLNKGKAETWVESRTVRQYDFEQPMELISVYRAIYPVGMITKGVVVGNVRKKSIVKYLETLRFYNGQQFYILDNDENVVFAYNPSTGAEEDYDPQDSIVTRLSSDLYSWTYVSVVPRQVIYESAVGMIGTLISVLGLSVAVSLLFAFVFTRLKYNRVLNVMQIIESKENCRADDMFMPSRYADEYDYIIEKMIKEYVEKAKLEMELSSKQYRLNLMETMALQSQINPHFLFNTLEMIKWECVELTKGANCASLMVENLSDVVRYSFSNPQELIRLGEEIEITKSYVEILMHRYVNKFSVDWRCEWELLDRMVIKLILQPIIENSVYHGIKEKQGFCKIRIRIGYQGKALCIQVADSGMGMEHCRLAEVRGLLLRGDTDDESIGLCNIYKRLRLVYGDRFSMRIVSAHGIGTAVRIWIREL